MRVYLAVASIIMLCGCAHQAAKMPSGKVAHPAGTAAAGGDQAAQLRALEDFKDCAIRLTAVEQFTCLNELDSASRNSAN